MVAWRIRYERSLTASLPLVSTPPTQVFWNMG